MNMRRICELYISFDKNIEKIEVSLVFPGLEIPGKGFLFRSLPCIQDEISS